MVGIKYIALELTYIEIWDRYNYYFPILALVIFMSSSIIQSITFMPALQFDLTTFNPYKNIAYAQIKSIQNDPFSNNSSQQWIDKNSGIKIVFGYSPAKPVVDSPTELRFIVQDLKTNKYLKNLLAHVSITTNSSGQEQTFRFNNVKVQNGIFSLKYLFPDYGTYQIIFSIRSNSSAVALASFPVIIPLQNSVISTLSAIPAGIAIIIVGIIVLVGVIIKSRRP